MNDTMNILSRRLPSVSYSIFLRSTVHQNFSQSTCLWAEKRQNTAVSKRRQESSLPSTSVATKAKEAAKDVSYGFVIVGGVLVTGFMFYMIFKELFSSNSPNGVYNTAQKRCIRDGRVSAVLGEPIKVFGEETGRGRRRHAAHQEWVDRTGRRHMAMKFYLKGPHNLGHVWLEAVENEKGNYEFKYLAVETQQYPKQTIVIEG